MWIWNGNTRKRQRQYTTTVSNGSRNILVLLKIRWLTRISTLYPLFFINHDVRRVYRSQRERAERRTPTQNNILGRKRRRRLPVPLFAFPANQLTQLIPCVYTTDFATSVFRFRELWIPMLLSSFSLWKFFLQQQRRLHTIILVESLGAIDFAIYFYNGIVNYFLARQIYCNKSVHRGWSYIMSLAELCPHLRCSHIIILAVKIYANLL